MNTDKDIVCVVSDDNNEEIANEAVKLAYVSSARVNDKGVQVILEAGAAPKLIKQLVVSNFNIEEVYKERKGLEQRYMELVEGGVR